MNKLIAVTLMLAAVAVADCDCRARVVHSYSYAPAYVAPVVVPVYAAQYVPVVVPTYSITYHDPTAALTAELQQLRQEMRALRQGPAAQPATTPPPAAAAEAPGKAHVVPFSVTFAGKCASCHDKATAAKGGNFVLLEGQSVAALNFKQALKISTMLATNKMPPGKDKLTEAEYAGVVEWLDGLK